MCVNTYISDHPPLKNNIAIVQMGEETGNEYIFCM